METLGQVLKSTRESVSLTLRQVEDATGLSNAYLSQLENDKIKKPSASVLYKLAGVYRINLDILLRAAGIIERSQATNPEETELEKKIAYYKDKLTTAQSEQVISFIKFLSSQNENGTEPAF